MGIKPAVRQHTACGVNVYTIGYYSIKVNTVFGASSMDRLGIKTKSLGVLLSSLIMIHVCKCKVNVSPTVARIGNEETALNFLLLLTVACL